MRRLGDFIKKSYMLYISLQEDISKLFSRIQFIILDFYHYGVIEVGAFAAKDVAERIADEVSITNH